MVTGWGQRETKARKKSEKKKREKPGAREKYKVKFLNSSVSIIDNDDDPLNDDIKWCAIDPSLCILSLRVARLVTAFVCTSTYPSLSLSLSRSRYLQSPIISSIQDLHERCVLGDSLSVLIVSKIRVFFYFLISSLVLLSYRLSLRSMADGRCHCYIRTLLCGHHSCGMNHLSVLCRVQRLRAEPNSRIRASNGRVRCTLRQKLYLWPFGKWICNWWQQWDGWIDTCMYGTRLSTDRSTYLPTGAPGPQTHRRPSWTASTSTHRTIQPSQRTSTLIHWAQIEKLFDFEYYPFLKALAIVCVCAPFRSL